MKWQQTHHCVTSVTLGSKLNIDKGNQSKEININNKGWKTLSGQLPDPVTSATNFI